MRHVHRVRKRLKPEAALVAAGAVLLAAWGIAVLDGHRFQRLQEERLERVLAASAAVPTPGSDPSSESRVAERTRKEARQSGLIGRIEIPRLGVSAIIAEGIDRKTLRRAVGHVPDTPFPGEKGNAGLAAHRDGLFRPLKDIQENDTIRVATLDGVFHYRVDSIAVVSPSHAEALDPTEEPSLTLVTCYPFYYVGTAPERFIVRAVRSGGPTGDDEEEAPQAAEGSPTYPSNITYSSRQVRSPVSKQSW